MKETQAAKAASKGLINSDIASLQDKLDKLKLQATLDPNAAQSWFLLLHVQVYLFQWLII